MIGIILRAPLVNINRIKEVVQWFKSTFQLRMDDKETVGGSGQPRTDEVAEGIAEL